MLGVVVLALIGVVLVLGAVCGLIQLIRGYERRVRAEAYERLYQSMREKLGRPR